MANTHSMKTRLAAILLALVLPVAIQAQDKPADDDNTTLLSGSMVHTDLEGGCWYLDASDGKHYELVGDEGVITALHTEGRMVQVRVKPTKGVSSTCMVGPIVQVVEDVTPQMHPTDLVMTTMHIDGTMHYDGKTWYVKTTKGLRYNFKTPPAKKYRHIGRHYVHTDRIVVNPGQQKLSGWILGPPQKTSTSATQQKKQPATY
jgi:hypothetical protein